MDNIKCGTLSDPHKRATARIGNEDAPACRMKLSGPGIDGHTTIHAARAVKRAVMLRDAQNYEYPQWIDMLFVSNNGELFAIPRTTRMEAE